jgi:ferredoxin
MGHLAGKDVYRRLGEKIDRLGARVPWNAALHDILKELYTGEEAEVVCRMPFAMSSLEKIARVTGMEKSRLKAVLDGLCEKGLVMDLWTRDKYRYMPSPMVIGIFELTMMRTGRDLNTKEWARMFNDYMHGDDSFYAANFGDGQRVSLLRALPHEEAVSPSVFVEVLDYEKATAIVGRADVFSIGICSCRHEKHHLGEKKCKVPLESCISLGVAAQYLVRRRLARQASRSEVLEVLQRSREMGLVFNADNVQKNVTFICQCCACCCNVLQGITRHGYPNAVVTSSLIARSDDGLCTGCGKCAKACPIGAVTMVPDAASTETKRKKVPVIDQEMCLGCGVCALKCGDGAMTLVKRGRRVLHPETTFHRIILQNLERGTLQYQLFDHPDRFTHRFMRAFVGAFFRLSPVQRALMSDGLRSRFLKAVETAASFKKMDWSTDI